MAGVRVSLFHPQTKTNSEDKFRRQIPKTNSEDKFRRRVPQGRRIREDPLKTNSEDAFREDDFHPEGELQPEDEFWRHIPWRRTIPPEEEISSDDDSSWARRRRRF